MKKGLLTYVIILSAAVVVMLLLKPSSFNADLDNSIDLVVPTNSPNENSRHFRVLINSKGNYSINNSVVTKDSLEHVIRNSIKSEGYETLLIESYQDTEMRYLVFVMEIANRNKIKAIIAVSKE